MKDTEKFVLAVRGDNNKEAKKLLERILKDKVAKKIKKDLGKDSK